MIHYFFFSWTLRISKMMLKSIMGLRIMYFREIYGFVKLKYILVDFFKLVAFN